MAAPREAQDRPRGGDPYLTKEPKIIRAKVGLLELA
jgi:hypothetical protein